MGPPDVGVEIFRVFLSGYHKPTRVLVPATYLLIYCIAPDEHSLDQAFPPKPENT